MTKEGLDSAKEVKYEISEQFGHYLDQLIKKGTYGKSRTEAVRMVVRDHIKQLLKDGGN